MKVYCQECGTLHEYSIKKPNFCQNCGKSFSLKAAAVEPQKNKPETEENDDDDDNDEEGSSIPQMDGLDVEIQTSSNAGISIKDLMRTAPLGNSDLVREADEPISERDFLSDFQKEAGALRPFSKKRRGGRSDP